MSEGFSELPPIPQPEQGESVVEKLKRLGGPENPEFLEVFARFVTDQMHESMMTVRGEIADTQRANLVAALNIAKMKAALGFKDDALEDLDYILELIYSVEDYSDLGGEANRLMSSLENPEHPIE